MTRPPTSTTRLTLALAAAALALLPLAARADDPAVAPPLVQAGNALPTEPWSVGGAVTDAPGHDVLSAEAGFPGITLGYTHGMSDTADWGVKLDLLYGILDTTETQFGLGVRIPLRKMLARTEMFSVVVHADPGLFTYASSSSRESLFGLWCPVGAALGFQPVETLRVSFAVDLPLAVQMLHSADLFLGPQVGFTAETFLNQNVSVGIDLKFGPMFVPTASSDAQLGFIAQAMLGYRL